MDTLFRNPQYISADTQGGIKCEIYVQTGESSAEWVPFTAIRDENPDYYDLMVADNPVPFVEPPVDMVAVRTEARAFVDATIGFAREAFITDIPGQQMTYQAKEAEAVAYGADMSSPKDMSQYPYIAAEAAALGVDHDTVATTYATLSAQWRTVGVALEALRIQHKALIDLATDDATVEAQKTTFQGELNALIGSITP